MISFRRRSVSRSTSVCRKLGLASRLRLRLPATSRPPMMNGRRVINKPERNKTPCLAGTLRRAPQDFSPCSCGTAGFTHEEAREEPQAHFVLGGSKDDNTPYESRRTPRLPSSGFTRSPALLCCGCLSHD